MRKYVGTCSGGGGGGISYMYKFKKRERRRSPDVLYLGISRRVFDDIASIVMNKALPT